MDILELWLPIHTFQVKISRFSTDIKHFDWGKFKKERRKRSDDWKLEIANDSSVMALINLNLGQMTKEYVKLAGSATSPKEISNYDSLWY